MRAYYAYLIHERVNFENTIIKGGRLYQQFLVDAFANVEEDRLDYIRANQSDLRSEIYKGIHEAILRGDVEGNAAGKIIRRQQLDNFVLKGGIQLHNNYVVPYNRELLLRYRAHINVEICCQSMLIKYLFKYHNIVYSGNESLLNVMKRPGLQRTMLTEWFECNKNDSAARDMYYMDFPNKFVWDSRQKQWSKRTRSFSLGRLTYIHPAAGELYFLRLLLSHVKGAQSFDDLRKVAGVLYPTFQLACKSLGLLGDDKEWADALSEAILTATSPQIRQLFVSLVLFCEVTDPNELFHQFWRSMYDDIIHRFRSTLNMPNLLMSDDELRNYVLYELELLFNASSTSLEKYKLPMPNARLLAEIRNKLLREELNYDIVDLKSQHSTAFPMLNHCQRNVYEYVATTVMQKKQALIFVHGHGGTGKTFLWHTIISKIRSEGLIVLAVASSGIASLLFPGGRTAHSRFKIPLMNTNLSHLLEMTSLIIWDEAPMNHRCCFEALDRSLRDILAHDQPFGGKTVLLGGDFRQILPVVTGGTKEDIIHASLSSSPLWHEFKIFTLNENMRLSSNGLSDVEKIELQLFAEWILMIGNGEISDIPFEDDYDTSLIKIPPDLLLDADSNPIASMVSSVYPCINNHCLDSVYFQERAIVTPKNSTVSMINDFIFNMLPENKHVYLSCDSISTSSTDAENVDLLYPVEFLNQLEFNGVPSHKLSLQVGTPIMLLRNLNPSAGLCNGTRLLVTQLADKVIEARIITGSSVGSHVFIPRITFPVNDERCAYTIRRRQFPIRPCYAMTINKSQGQSLKVVGVFLQEQVFTHGQLYVALSRVTSKKGLKIITLDDKGKPLDYAKNIVYKDIISSVIKS
ncbi:DNA helicase [Salix suchowensis]|nr:DNA helicase [Salix suchowensis]